MARILSLAQAQAAEGTRYHSVTNWQGGNGGVFPAVAVAVRRYDWNVELIRDDGGNGGRGEVRVYAAGRRLR